LTRIKSGNSGRRHLIHVSDQAIGLGDHIGMQIIKKISVHFAASGHDVTSRIDLVFQSLPR